MDIGPSSKPIEIFDQWLREAGVQAGVREATAMSVATVDDQGQVQSRMVLCKEWSEEGFKFYTNYDSPKGREIGAHPQVALLFYWDTWNRQIRITGRAEKTSRQDSETYWRSRARDSQLSQYISHQSAPVESRQALQDEWHKAEQKFKGREVPCPPHWGGYLVRPQTIEFWIGQAGRLHDRFHFEKAGSNWTFRRLSP